MKPHLVWALLIQVLLIAGCESEPAGGAVDGPMHRLRESTVWQNVTIEWLDSAHQYGGACVRLTAPSQTLYFDPAHIDERHYERSADLILITHPHGDHCQSAAVQALVHSGTEIITVQECADQLSSVTNTIVVVDPGEIVEVSGVEVQVVPAYNLASDAHLKSSGWVGFVVQLDDARFYHSGDTSHIPAMSTLENIDVAFVTVRETYMMSGAEAVQAAEAIGPQVIIPVHWQNAERSHIDHLVASAPDTTDVRVLEYTSD